MRMRAPRHRRSRSRSKDRDSYKSYDRRGLLKSLSAFVAGALSVMFLWGRLRVLGVAGPWAAARYRGEGDDGAER